MGVKWCIQDHLEQIQLHLVIVEADQLCWHSTSKTWVPKSRDLYMPCRAARWPSPTSQFSNAQTPKGPYSTFKSKSHVRKKWPCGLECSIWNTTSTWVQLDIFVRVCLDQSPTWSESTNYCTNPLVTHHVRLPCRLCLCITLMPRWTISPISPGRAQENLRVICDLPASYLRATWDHLRETWEYLRATWVYLRATWE